MNTIIEKIRAEVNRLKKDVDNTPLATEQIAGYLFALVDVQKRLSDLEKEEKPSDGLEEEIQSFWNRASGFQPKFATLEVKENGFAVIARHFAKWGAEHAREQLMNDGNVILSEEDFDAEKEKSMERGYNLCKEQMMNEAVEWDYTLEDGRIEFEGDPLPCLNPILNLPYPKFKPGQKVRVVIVKED